MTPKSFLALATATLVAVLLAMVTSSTSNTGNVIADRGESFVSGLAEKANSIASITTVTSDGTTTVTKKGNTFVDASGFPIKDETARQLVTSLALLSIEERKTDVADRHADLELAAPDAKSGAGQRITLKDSGDRVVADVIAGRREFTVGGTRGGQYVRNASDTQAYLVRGTVNVPSGRSAWFDTSLTSVENAKVLKVTAMAEDKPVFEVSRNGDKLDLTTVPEKRKTDPAKMTRLARLVAPLSFADVRKAKADSKAEGPVLTIEAKDGVKITLTALNKAKGDDNWFRVEAVSSDKASEDLVKKLTEKAKGFEFQLSSRDAELFWWTPNDLTTEAGS